MMSPRIRSSGGRFWLRACFALLAIALLTSLSFGQAAAPDAAVAATVNAPAVSIPSTTAVGEPNSGDTAWMLTSSALVLLMLPGLALFYAGMVRRKNVLGTMMHSFAAMGIIGIEWVVLGYAMSFGTSYGGVIGWDPSLLFLKGITPDLLHKGYTIPELVFVMFQGMFAIITPALIAGAFAERVKFSAFAVFTLLWGILIYNPLAHWVWGGGWLGAAPAGIGALDYAGGTVVHISAGVSALVAALYIGKRIGYPNSVLQPNSLVLTLLGAGMLWFGWFGFNAGSAVAAGKGAGLAFATTQIAAAAGGMAWLFAEWLKHGRPTALGFASGLVAGLVAVTPAAGYVAPWAAIIIGAVAGVVCYIAVLTKAKLGYDDALDAFGVHGVGGFIGAVLTGVFALTAFGGSAGAIDGNPKQVWIQIVAALAAAAFAAIMTLIIVYLIDKTIGFRMTRYEEIEGMDGAIHGEQGWMLDQTPAPAMEVPGNAPVEPVAAPKIREKTQV